MLVGLAGAANVAAAARQYGKKGDESYFMEEHEGKEEETEDEEAEGRSTEMFS